MQTKVPYAKSDLYRMAKSRTKYSTLIELILNARYDKEAELRTVDDEACMTLIQRYLDKSTDDPRSLVGIYELVVIQEKYPVVLHFLPYRKTVIHEILIPVISDNGIKLHIMSLNEILSYAEKDDMNSSNLRRSHTRDHIPGTKYYF